MSRAHAAAYAVLRNRQDAEDAVQAAVILAMKNVSGLRNPDAFQPWVLRIVANQARGALRRRRTVPFDESVQLAAEDRSDIDQTIDLHDAVARLPDAHRAAVLLHYFAGLSTKEVAARLNRPAGTIRRILSEAYWILERHLGPDREEDR